MSVWLFSSFISCVISNFLSIFFNSFSKNSSTKRETLNCKSFFLAVSLALLSLKLRFFVILIFIGYGTVIPVYIVAFLIIPDPSGKMALGERSKTKVIHKRPVKKVKPLEQDDSDDDWSDF